MGRHSAGTRRRQKGSGDGSSGADDAGGGIPRARDPLRGETALGDRGGRPGAPYDTGSHAVYDTGPQRPVRGGHPAHPDDDWFAGGHGGYAGPIPGPRSDYVAAFDDPGYDPPRRPSRTAPPRGPVPDPGYGPAATMPLRRPRDDWSNWPQRAEELGRRPALAPDDDEPPLLDRLEGPKPRNRGRYVTGIAAAAVTVALGAAIAVQATGDDGGEPQAQAGKAERPVGEDASRSDGRVTPTEPAHQAAVPYDQKMGQTYPLAADLQGGGHLKTVPGAAKAPGKGTVIRYRVDVEEGMGLDARLFADAVHKTLNDKRSWGGNGERTFERVSSGKAKFVITLASPGTTAKWCARSGLDTAEQNVSCDSASTTRVMINAYRWAQGAKTYGDDIHAYRQMLINHEVGHRLGHGHVGCPKDGAPAPVMMQQTKFLSTDGATCKPNAWPYPKRG
ncbi:DUF3152 domain-containing protein [Streptomyces boninensis]|uniref:DUF3152 domain-containing protein n=1 Tax=Streptomyces boninensis TaxID=2039455 RepID=UPI003B213108